jgi:hypothetical protein
MGATSEEVAARELLARFGKKIRRVTHGDLWGLPGGQTLTVYTEDNPSSRAADWRAWKNTLADIKRALRAAGVKFEEREDEEDEMASDVKSVAVNIADQKLSALGIHVQRKQRVIDEVEATVDARALAHLLGLVAAEDTNAAVVVVDLNGHEVEAPLVVRVVITRESAAGKAA